jgi:hypothetical protein
MVKIEDQAILQRRGRRDGLFFGLLSGLAFALAAWGWDAVALSRISSYLPWFKLVVGGLLVVIVAGLVGWLVAVLDHGLAGLIAWGLTGAALGWLAGRLPFQGMSLAGGLLDPRFRGVEIYPLFPILQGRSNVTAVLIAALAALAGVFQLVALDQAQGSHSRLGYVLALAMCSPLMIMAGGLADTINNRPLREPQVNMVELIRFAVQMGEEPFDHQLALEMHMGSLNAIRSLMGEPRLVMLGDYDSMSMVSVDVEIEFDGGWARCTVLNGTPSYCRPTDPIYQEAFVCLLQDDQPSADDCTFEITDEARQWLAARRDRLGSSPETEVVGRLGASVLVDVVGRDGVVIQCRFEGAQPVVLVSCDQMAAAGS